jgi:predicted transcriptional regulator YdeE
MSIKNREPKLIHVNEFTVIGLSVRTINSDEFNPSTAKLPDLWERFFSDDNITRPQNSPVFGVYSDYESNAEGYYTVTAGIQSELPSNTPVLQSLTILSGDYLVFENQGVMPQAVIEAWKSVWHYFESKKEVTRRFQTDFERYKGTTDIAIYIGI